MTTKTTKRALISVLAGVYSLFIMWLFGIDYTERNFQTGWALLAGHFVAALTWAWPGWMDHDD